MKDKTAGFIMAMSSNMTKVQKMTDDELADALRTIWADLDMSSLESAVIGESMARLMGLMQRAESEG